jgi:hypothetical protein
VARRRSRRQSPPDRLAGLPGVLLWAWERPEDLRFAARLGVGVAVLDRTITMRGPRIETAPRRQPVRLDPGDARGGRRARRGRFARLRPQVAAPADAAAAIAAGGAAAGIRAVQIDFDADGLAACVSTRPILPRSGTGCLAICRCR